MDSDHWHIVREFRDQLVNFLDEIIEQFPRECDFVLIRMFIIKIITNDLYVQCTA